jgi:predicted RNA-binding Zn ribbon-like protein
MLPALKNHLAAGASIQRRSSSEPTPTPTLARRAALELGEIDVERLKRCERPACDLVFYDTTRSGTRRWHAESSCGARERQPTLPCRPARMNTR